MRRLLFAVLLLCPVAASAQQTDTTQVLTPAGRAALTAQRDSITALIAWYDRNLFVRDSLRAAQQPPPDTIVPPPANCADVVDAWRNIAFPEQTGGLIVEWDATPGSAAMDGVMGTSAGPATAYSSLATIVRFWTSGRIEVRSGGNYVTSPVAYAAGVTYRFRLAIDIPTHRYSATVTPAGGTETAIGTELAFRNEQASIARLSNFAARASGGTLKVCLVRVEPTSGPPPPPPPPPDTVVVPPPPPDTSAPPPIPAGPGIWISRDEIMALPMSGAGWSNVKSAADGSCGTPNLSNQDDNANVCVLAKALVYARTGGASYRDGVLAALRSIANSGTYSGRALALGRELAAYVIAADVIALSQIDASLDASFRAKIDQLRKTATSGGPANLIRCHEQRPNNWGTWCGFSRIVVALYLGDRADLDRAASVFRGWTGERSAYAGFTYGDLWWQSNPSQPVGVNPRGATLQGRDVDGVLPDDQRRCGAFQWPPCVTDYVWGALEGITPTALVLHRAGYTWALASGDSAIVRAYRWVYGPGNNLPTGNDTWQPYLVNRLYGTSYPLPSSVQPGKNLGWTDWTHRP